MPEVKASAFPPANEPTAADGLIILQDGELRLAPLPEITGDNNQHLSIPMAALNSGTGGNKPTEVQVGHYDGYSYTVGKESFLSVEVPHNADLTKDLEFHLTMLASVNTGNNKWQILWASTPYAGGEDVTSPTHNGTIDSGDVAVPAIFNHLVHTKIILPAGNVAFGDIIGIELSRVAAGTNDAGGTATIIGFHMEFASNKLGTG